MYGIFWCICFYSYFGIFLLFWKGKKLEAKIKKSERKLKGESTMSKLIIVKLLRIETVDEVELLELG